MTLSLAPMTVERASEIAAWRYGDPCDADVAAARHERALLDGEHAAILDDEASSASSPLESRRSCPVWSSTTRRAPM